MRVEIHGRDLPGRDCCGHTAVAVGVQRGRDVVKVHPAGVDAVTWAFDITDVRDRAGAADVRGPFVHGRIIDLSRGSARALGMGGTTYVSLQVLN